MSTALLLVSHEGIASNLLATAAAIVNETPENIAYVEVPMDSSIESVQQNIQQQIDQFSENSELLILTDIYGGTPSNMASCFLKSNDTKLISGLNLAMLIKAINYHELPLNELIEKIVTGGRQSIAQHDNESPVCK